MGNFWEVPGINQHELCREGGHFQNRLSLYLSPPPAHGGPARCQTRLLCGRNTCIQVQLHGARGCILKMPFPSFLLKKSKPTSHRAKGTTFECPADECDVGGLRDALCIGSHPTAGGAVSGRPGATMRTALGPSLSDRPVQGRWPELVSQIWMFNHMPIVVPVRLRDVPPLS